MKAEMDLAALMKLGGTMGRAEYGKLVIADLEAEGRRWLERAGVLRDFYQVEKREMEKPGADETGRGIMGGMGAMPEGGTPNQAAGRGGGKGFTHRGGKLLVKEGVRRVLPEMTTEFGAEEMAAYCAEKFKGEAVMGGKWTAEKLEGVLAALAKSGEIARTGRGRYEVAGENRKRKAGTGGPPEGGTPNQAARDIKSAPIHAPRGEPRAAAALRGALKQVGSEFTRSEVEPHVEAALGEPLKAGWMAEALNHLRGRNEIALVSPPSAENEAVYRKR